MYAFLMMESENLMESAEPATDAIGFVLAVYGVVLGIALLFSLAVYVITSLGLSRMAKACHLPRPYLAWIPLVNSYLLGQVAECGASRGGKKGLPYRKILLGLEIGALGVVFLLVVGMFAAGIVAALSGSPLNAMSFGLMAVLGYLLAMGISLAYSIFCYIAYWHIFRLFDETNAVIYLVVSIFFSIATPFFFLILSGKTPALDPEPEPETENNEPTYWAM